MRNIITSLFLSLALVITGCSDDQKNNNNEAISILYPDGIEALAITHLTKTIFNENGIDVTITNVEQGPLYASLAQGGSDLFLDAWLPHTHKKYWDKYGNSIDHLGTLFNDASTGLVVPSYVKIDSIKDLNDNIKLFSGKIYGVGPGAGIHTNTIKAIDAYQLDYEQITSTESAMLASLKRAVLKEEPIIITGWKPHSKWNHYDLKMLDDPKEIYLVDRIDILSRQEFSDDYPKVAQFLKSFQLTNTQLNELIEMVSEDSRNPDIGAKAFYDKYAAEFKSI